MLFSTVTSFCLHRVGRKWHIEILDSLLSGRCWLGLGMRYDHPGLSVDQPLFLATLADWTNATTNTGQDEELSSDVACVRDAWCKEWGQRGVKGVYHTALAQKYLRHWMGNYSEIKCWSNKVKFNLVPLIASKQCLKCFDSKFKICTTTISGVGTLFAYNIIWSNIRCYTVNTFVIYKQTLLLVH